MHSRLPLVQTLSTLAADPRVDTGKVSRCFARSTCAWFVLKPRNVTTSICRGAFLLRERVIRLREHRGFYDRAANRLAAN